MGGKTMTAILCLCILCLCILAGAQSPLCTGKETTSTKCTFKVTLRDFMAQKIPNTQEGPNLNSKYLADFEAISIRGNGPAAANGMVKKFLNNVTHKPELSDHYPQMHSPQMFAAWYDECAGPAGLGMTCGTTTKLCKKTQQSGIPCGYSYKMDSLIEVEYNENTKTYIFDQASFFPLDNNNKCPQPLVGGKCGWGNQPTNFANNFAFTTEINLLFTFKGGETFEFSGDDDVWVFIGSRLAVDIGGVHPQLCKTLELPKADCTDCRAVVSFCDGGEDYKFDASYLKVGNTYRFDLFHAERHTTESNFNFETTLNLKKDTCPDFLDQLKKGVYTEGNVHTGLLVTDENCPAAKFTFEEFEGSSFCDIKTCKPGYEAIGKTYLRLTCDGDMLRSSGKGFSCRKITGSTTGSATDTTMTTNKVSNGQKNPQGTNPTGNKNPDTSNPTGNKNPDTTNPTGNKTPDTTNPTGNKNPSTTGPTGDTSKPTGDSPTTIKVNVAALWTLSAATFAIATTMATML